MCTPTILVPVEKIHLCEDAKIYVDILFHEIFYFLKTGNGEIKTSVRYLCSNKMNEFQAITECIEQLEKLYKTYMIFIKDGNGSKIEHEYNGIKVILHFIKRGNKLHVHDISVGMAQQFRFH